MLVRVLENTPLESSRLQPTAPASSSRSTSSFGAIPYPPSTSADTGTSTARAIRATAANISSAGVAPSSYPRAAATPALGVASAG